MTAPPDQCELSSYAELVEVITNLRFLVREKRRRERLSMREVGRQTGLKSSTMSRFESGGHDVSVEALVAPGEVAGGREVRPDLDPSYQVERLRDAAATLNGPLEIGVPLALCAPLRGVLREAAERIEMSGRTLGQPVNYALEIASVILGEDLGHNR